MVFLGHTVFLVLTRPSAHNKNFPFHVRTTQIGIMEAISSHTTVGNHTLESFGHHGYGVSPANGRYLEHYSFISKLFSLRKMLRKSMDSWGITTAKSLQRRPSKVDPFKVQSQRSNARMQETSLSTTNGVVSKNSTNNTK